MDEKDGLFCFDGDHVSGGLFCAWWGLFVICVKFGGCVVGWLGYGRWIGRDGGGREADGGW